MLDVNVMEEFYWSSNDNSTFATNLAQWIGCTTPVIFCDDFETGDVSGWSVANR